MPHVLRTFIMYKVLHKFGQEVLPYILAMPTPLSMVLLLIINTMNMQIYIYIYIYMWNLNISGIFY